MITYEKYLIPIYDYRLHVIIYDDFKEVRDLLPPKERDSSGSGTIEMRGSSIVLISIKGFSDIAHEAGHIKNNIWNYIGYKAQLDNDEVDSYLIGYIVDIVTEVFCHHKGQTCNSNVCEVGGFFKEL